MNDLSQSLVTINLSYCIEFDHFHLLHACPSLETVKLDHIIGCEMIDLNDTDLGEKDYFHNGVKNTRIKTVSLKFASYLNGDSLTKAALMCPNMETLDMYSSRVTEA